MKKYFYAFVIAAGFMWAPVLAEAQTVEKNIEQKTEQKKDATKVDPAQGKTVTKDATKEAADALERAAESIQRSAEKMRVVVEDKADKLAKTSQPAIESFLVASSGLIEKIALELEKMLNEKPVKK